MSKSSTVFCAMASGILKRDQRAPPVVEQFDCVPVWRRDDRLARAQRIRQRSGNNLRLMAVGSDVNVGGANELQHLFRADEAVVEDHLRFHSHFLRQSLQTGSILVAFAAQNVRMGRARDDVDNILVLGQESAAALELRFRFPCSARAGRT